MKLKPWIAVIAALGCTAAQAADSIQLNKYVVTGTYALDPLNGTGAGISGLEASAVTYARDRGTLFFVGDEGRGVVEISRTGQTIGNNLFNWAGTGSTNNDTEALTYLGNGRLVVGEERLQNAYSFDYVANATVNLASTPFVSFGPTIGNVGIEGFSYDPRNGSFVTVKQDNPAQLRIFNSLPFSTAAAADLVPNIAFSGPPTTSSLFGLNSLSDVQTLAPVDALLGTAAADNLLVLSLDSRKLIEIDRLGNIKSMLDLSGIVPFNAIEGVTIDENGVIYLIAEQDQRSNAPANSRSQLIVLTAVPEPETYAMMLAGLGLLGFVAARRRQTS
jgi:uncharacterized protein YjiK